MASFLVCLGRFAFFVLMGIQSFSLASYPATYEDKDGFYALVLLYLLPLGLWLFIMCKDDNLQWLFVVWLLYTIVFVIFIGVIFGGDEPLENKLKKEEFFGPNVLKMTLCLSPVLLLLLLSTGTDSMSYIELTGMLSLRIALDLFHGVEMLEVIPRRKRTKPWYSKKVWKRHNWSCLLQLLVVDAAAVGNKAGLWWLETSEVDISITKNSSDSFR